MLGPRLLKFAVIALVVTVGVLAVHYYEGQALKEDTALFLAPEASQASAAQQRLSLLAFSLQNNPHFSLSSTHLERLDQTLTELKESTEALSNFYDEADRQLIMDTLYPFAFWEQLMETEQLRRSFVETPEHSLAHEYLDALTLTTQLYTDFIDNQRTFYATTDKKVIGYLDGKVTTASAITWLNELQFNAKTTEEWAAKQRSCLSYYTSSCRPGPIAIIEPVVASESLPIDPEAHALVTQFALYENSHATATGAHGEPLGEVPVTLYHGECSQSGEATQAQLWWTAEGKHKNPSVRFSYIDEILFYQHAGGENPFSVLMSQHDVPYQYQAINHYMCWHYGFDHADITTLHAVWDFLQANRIFESDKDNAELAALEHEIRSNTNTVSSDTISRYLSLATTLLADHNQKITAEQIKKLQQLSLLYRDKSRYTAEALTSLLRILRFTRFVFEKSAVSLPADVITIHSNPGMMLQGANNTIAPNRTSPVQSYASDTQYPNLVTAHSLTTELGKPLSVAQKYVDDTLNIAERIRGDF